MIYSKDQLIEMSRSLFRGKLNEIIATRDGNFFIAAHEGYANNHAKQNKQELPIRITRAMAFQPEPVKAVELTGFDAMTDNDLKALYKERFGKTAPVKITRKTLIEKLNENGS